MKVFKLTSFILILLFSNFSSADSSSSPMIPPDAELFQNEETQRVVFELSDEANAAIDMLSRLYAAVHTEDFQELLPEDVPDDLAFFVEQANENASESIDRSLQLNCLLYGNHDRSCGESRYAGLVELLLALTPTEYNIVLAEVIFPTYIDDLKFQQVFDYAIPALQNHYLHIRRDELSSQNTGARVLMGATAGLGMFLTLRGAWAARHWVVSRSYDTYYRVRSMVNRPAIRPPALRNTNNLPVPGRTLGFFSTWRATLMGATGFTTFGGVSAAVLSSLCESYEACYFGTTRKRTNVVDAFAKVQTLMTCQMQAELDEAQEAFSTLSDWEQNIDTDFATLAGAHSEYIEKFTEISSRVLYQTQSPGIIMDYVRNSHSANGSFQAVIDELGETHEWYENYVGQVLEETCPSASLGNMVIQISQITSELRPISEAIEARQTQMRADLDEHFYNQMMASIFPNRYASAASADFGPLSLQSTLEQKLGLDFTSVDADVSEDELSRPGPFIENIPENETQQSPNETTELLGPRAQ